MNKEQIISLYERSEAFVLDPDIEKYVAGPMLDARTLKFIASLIETIHPVHWMEFGSGLSTLLTARLLSENGHGRLYTVDHSDYYLEKTREICRQCDNIVYFHAPISPYQHKHKWFLTYSDDYALNIPREVQFDVVLIDGPLGHKYGREAPLYQIAAHLKPETIIVLHDAEREPESRAIANWRLVWGEHVSVVPFLRHKGLAVIQIHEPALVRRFPFHILTLLKSWLDVQKTLKQDGQETSPFFMTVFPLLSLWDKMLWKLHELRTKKRA